MSKKLVILDSGHAKSTPGKRSPDSSLLEWEFNNEMQYLIKKRLEAHGIIVHLTNPNPGTVKDIGLTARANDGNKKWKDLGKPEALFVSLHANAAGSCSQWLNARGVEVYHANNASQKSKDAALIVCNAIFNGVHKNIDNGFKNRGRKAANFTVIYKAACPSINKKY